MLDLHPLSPGFGAEASASTSPTPLTDAAFAEHRARVLRARRCWSLRAQSLTPAQFLAFARRFGPPRAARDRPVPSSGRPEHPDPVEPRRRTASRSGCRTPARTSTPTIRISTVPARATTLYSIEVPEAWRQHAVREPVRRVRRPVRRDEAPHRAAARHPSLRQPQRPGRDEPHRRIGADRRAEGEDAADHAPDRAPASGHRPQGALCGVGQLVRHRRHAGRRSARAARRAGRARDAAEIPVAASRMASATSSSGTTRRCCIRRR